MTVGTDASGPSPRKAGASAGLAGAAVGLLVAGVLHTVWSRVTFPPVSVAEAVARLTPGKVATYFIDLLQHRALPLTVAVVALGLVGVSAGLGSLLPRVAPRVRGGSLEAAGLLSVPVYATALAAFRSNMSTVGLPVYGLVLASVFAASAWATSRVYERLIAPAVPHDATRRAVTSALAVGGAGLLLGWAELGRILFPRPNPGRLALDIADLTPASAPPADAAFDRIPGISPRITPIASHYVVDEEIIDPDVDPAAWHLRIGGVVDRPYQLTYDELTALPAIEQFQTLECISNPVGGDLMSTARWTGVPLATILERAGVRPGAVEVVSRAIGGYSDSIPIEQAMLPTTLVAIGMNGRVLPREHGFPARLLVPGLYGMKQPKWLEGIEVVDRPYVGYWEERGWIKAAVVKTMSRIDGGGEVDGELVVAGVAFAGTRGIAKVEVTPDSGKTWDEAELEPELSGFTWRRWRLPLALSGKGGSEIRVRATDGEGALQVAEITPPHPSGATGYDRRLVDVS